MKYSYPFVTTTLLVFLLLANSASTLYAADVKKPFLLTVPVSGMNLDPELRNQVSGLALTVEDAGWPAMTMLGNPYGTLGELAQLKAGAGLTPVPFQFGAVRQVDAGQLVDQQVNDVTNTMTFRNDKNDSLKVTVTRLSPAIMLESSGKECELFGEADKPTPERNSVFPPPIGKVKPLRWAIPGADGKVVTGVLGNMPSVQFPIWLPQRLAIVTPSLAPEKSTLPLVDDLGRTWLLLWYGAGSPYISSKIPAVFIGTGYHEGARRETFFQADVPFLFIFDKSPLSIELRKDGDINRLIVTFTDQTGKIVMLPLFGHDAQAAALTEKWVRDFPAEIKTRCSDWAKRLGDFPVNVAEKTSYDEKADRVTCAETFEYVNVRPGGEKTVLVRPMLALGLQQKLPAVVTPQPVNLKYATQFGPLLAIPGDRYEWHLDGLGKYVNGQAVIGPSHKKSAVLEKELSVEVDKVLAAGHLAPWIVSRQAPWCPQFGTRYGTDPSEALYFLSDMLPVLPEAQQAKVREYLKKEYAAFPPDQVLRLNVTEGARREFFSGPNRFWQLYNWFPSKCREDEYYENVPSLFRAYGVARYYISTNLQPTKAIIEFWRQAMRESLVGRDWATMGWFWGKYAFLQKDNSVSPGYRVDYYQFTPRAVQRDAAGLIGYLRMCRMVGEKGEPEAWSQLSRLMMLRFALVEYGRYMAESGLFRMPENPTAARYLALSGDFSKAENHFEQVGEVNQHEVTMYSGASKINNYWYGGFMTSPIICNGNNQSVFLDLTPEVGQMLKDWGLQTDVARYVKHYAEVQPVWYKAYSDSEHLTIVEFGLTMASDSYQYFTAHAWIAGTTPEELELYIDEPWAAIGDFFYMHKLAETIKAYRGVKWERGKRNSEGGTQKRE